MSVVKQRLRLASVSRKLLDIYADDGMTLDQLMAFTVNGGHERQEQVFERLPASRFDVLRKCWKTLPPGPKSAGGTVARRSTWESGCAAAKHLEQGCD